MKYKYRFRNGEEAEIDVADEWVHLLEKMDRQEYNIEQKEKRKTSSLEQFNPDDIHMDSGENVEAAVLAAAETEWLRRVLLLLPARQRHIIEQVYLADRQFADIAREVNRDESTVRHTVDSALRWLRKYFLR